MNGRSLLQELDNFDFGHRFIEVDLIRQYEFFLTVDPTSGVMSPLALWMLSTSSSGSSVLSKSQNSTILVSSRIRDQNLNSNGGWPSAPAVVKVGRVGCSGWMSCFENFFMLIWAFKYYFLKRKQ